MGANGGVSQAHGVPLRRVLHRANHPRPFPPRPPSARPQLLPPPGQLLPVGAVVRDIPPLPLRGGGAAALRAGEDPRGGAEGEGDRRDDHPTPEGNGVGGGGCAEDDQSLYDAAAAEGLRAAGGAAAAVEAQARPHFREGAPKEEFEEDQIECGVIPNSIHIVVGISC